MHQDDLFSEDRLRRYLLQQLVKDSPSDVSEVDLANTLVQLVHSELVAYGTHGKCRIEQDDDIRLLLRASAACCWRLGLDFPDVPFRDYTGFRRYWSNQGMKGSWSLRRDFIDELFEALEEELDQLMYGSWDSLLAKPVTPHSETGWAVVDREIRELRQRFKIARSDQDHNAVGLACIRVLECLGDVAFDPILHLPFGQPVPARDQTKNRFDLVISYYLPGAENESIRRLSRLVVELAQSVKHNPTPTRLAAGIPADSVILLTNMLRRICLENVLEQSNLSSEVLTE